MSEWKAKRFWETVSVEAQDDGFAIHLDGRPVRTPAKAPLLVPTHGFAEVIAQEWRDQTDEVNPGTMPATRTANVAIDKVSLRLPQVVAHLVEYGASDLLCYRAEGPSELVQRQAAKWDPLLAWSAATLNAPLQTIAGIMPVPQPPQSLENFRTRLSSFDAFSLSAFHELVSLSGSLVLAFAVDKNHVSATSAWSLSRLDEVFQQEQWGNDEEADAAAAIKQTAFEGAANLLNQLKKP